MALPSSGPLLASDVGTEMSQSNLPNYSFTEWASGAWNSGSAYDSFFGSSSHFYAPINVSSPQGTFFTGSVYSGMNMSRWYSYNHTAVAALGTTASLISRITDYCYPSSMVVFDAGTSNITISINISGSVYEDGLYTGPGVVVYYGKPWGADAKGTGSTIPITGSITPPSPFDQIIDTDMTFNYNYTYDANRGRYLYFVYYSQPCYLP